MYRISFSPLSLKYFFRKQIYIYIYIYIYIFDNALVHMIEIMGHLSTFKIGAPLVVRPIM